MIIFLETKSINEVITLIEEHWPTTTKIINVPLEEALDLYLAEDLYSNEDIPSFNKASVDGYCLLSKDTQGASQAMPSLLKMI
ncbi:MAG: molybdopterin molybdenumtransferase MoeA, partial [Bacilli bacterium]